MTSCGFYLLFCRDLVCTYVFVCVCVHHVFPAFVLPWLKFMLICICVSFFFFFFKYHCFLKICARKSAASAVSVITNLSPLEVSVSFWIENYLLDVIVKNQRISHALAPFPQFCLFIWIYFITSHSMNRRVFDVSVMVRYWMNRGEMWCFLVNLQDRSKYSGRKGRAKTG